jgi:cytochrome P450
LGFTRVITPSYGFLRNLSPPTRKIHPPGPSGEISLTDPNGDEISQFEMLGRLQKEYGDVFQYKTFAGSMYFFNHPDHIKQIFQRLDITRTPLLSIVLGEGVLAVDNEHWKRQRRLMLPEFKRPNVANFTALIRDTTTSHIDGWCNYVNTGEPIDIVQAMTRLTLSVVSRTLFSVDMDKETSSFLNSFTIAIKYLGDIANTTSFNDTMRISPATNTQFQQAVGQMNSVVSSIIRDRRKSTARPDDLLSLLLDAVDVESGKPLTDEQIKDEVITMLVAGHETTSLGLTWVWYMLGHHPEVENRIGNEIDETLAGRKISYEDIANLKYSRMVLEETMRLYPPVAAIWRQPRSEVGVGGYTIPEKTGILVSPFLTHRHKDFWSDPLAFNPERFNPETAPKRHPFAYFPFGGGRHVCLGKHFAMLESQVILATVLQRYRIRLLDREPAMPHFLITLRPKNGLVCALESHVPATT